MFVKGALLGIVNILLFCLFYWLDMLPSGRFILTICSIVVFFLVTVYCIDFYFGNSKLNFMNSILTFFTILSFSSLLCIGFDYWFNKSIDTEYKYILAKERIEEINKRRDRKGVGVYEIFNPEVVDKKHTVEASAQALFNSLILNLVVSLIIFPVGLLYNKVRN
jgi:hypothetical protein